MGYYTRHELEHNDTAIHGPDHEEDITELSGYPYNLFNDGEIKWYNHDEDMKAYSKRYPKVTFIISGVGEEEGDYWKAYYKNGKVATYAGIMSVEYHDDDYTEDSLL
jgi:hypothetical protein